ncbi:unnamed protein product, partial [marine sediment metagenome]
MNTKNLTLFLICFVFVNIFGYILIVRQNLVKCSKDLTGKFALSVFVKKEEKTPEVLAEKIRKLEHSEIEQLEFIPKEKTKEKLALALKKEITPIESNPFP